MTEIKLVAIDGVIHMSTAEFWKVQKDIRDNAIEECKSVILQTIDNEMLVDTLFLRINELKEQK